MTYKVAKSTPAGEFVSDVKLGKWLDTSKAAVASGHDQALSVKDLEAAWSPRFAASEIEELVIPRRTMARRKASSSMLTADEVDRAIRLARVQTKADRVFGEAERASLWLRSPNKRLSGQSPLQVLKTEAGAMLVEEMLVQIDHGMYV
jgi:putative toxin-antitoxin system antitoxin component (TIGR02293 family)